MKKDTIRRGIMIPLMLSFILLLSLQSVPAKDTGKVDEIVVSFQEDIVTLDPAVGYDWQNWDLIRSMNSALLVMGFKERTPLPDLAETYTISEDSRTYTFRLRKGVLFGNGREVTARDVKYSLERTIDPETKSPGAGFYESIEGFDEMQAGKSETVSGIEVMDQYNLRFRLWKKDATFLQALAMNFACVIPREAVEKPGVDFGRNPVGCGPFRLKEWVPGRRLVIERNPEYFIKGIPRCDRIRFELGLSPAVAMLKFERGEVDILGDGIPMSRMERVRSHPRYRPHLVEREQLQTSYIAMNTRIQPFDDHRVRRSVNMAVDKEKIIAILKDTAVVANQPLPPKMPGYDNGYKGYPYDKAGAKALLSDSGYPEGFNTELYALMLEPYPQIARSIQHDLSLIGINAVLKLLPQDVLIRTAGDPDKAPMVLSSGLAWLADFPDPSNFYGPILGCEGVTPGGWNWASHCNREIEELAVQADFMSDPDEKTAREALWRKIFIRIMDDALWVPLYNKKRITLVSSRIRGVRYIYSWIGGNTMYWMLSLTLPAT